MRDGPARLASGTLSLIHGSFNTRGSTTALTRVTGLRRILGKLGRFLSGISPRATLPNTGASATSTSGPHNDQNCI